MCDETASSETILIVEDDVLVRTALADYLRKCGYRIIQASNEEEARIVLGERDIPVHVLFNAIHSFELTAWTRKQRPDLQVITAGNLEKAAHAASDLCEEGPHLKKPYEPQQVIDWIKRLQATKTR